MQDFASSHRHKAFGAYLLQDAMSMPDETFQWIGAQVDDQDPPGWRYYSDIKEILECYLLKLTAVNVAGRNAVAARSPVSLL